MPRVVLLALVLSLPLFLSAQALKLASVQISGSKRLPADKVAAASGLTIGESVTLQGLQEAADRLAELGLFDFVSYRYQTMGDTISVTFIVEETARLRPCEFDNFVWLSRDQLLERLKQEIPLFTGEAPPGGYLTEEITRVLEKILTERGIQAQAVHLVHVVPRVSGVEERFNLFRIEGVSVPVASLRFLAKDKQVEEKLHEASQILLDQDYSRTFLDEFSQGTLLPLYRSRGYLRAQFERHELEYLGGDNGAHLVRVTFPVREGAVYRVREIRWRGNQLLSGPALVKRVSLHPGDVANTVQLAADLEKIREQEYGRRGYIQAQIGFSPELDDEARMATLNIQVEEGDLYRFQSLVIEGLPAPTAKRLTKKWKLKPGEPYDSTYASTFINHEVPPLIKRVSPQPRSINFTLKRDDAQKTVTVILRFR